MRPAAPAGLLTPDERARLIKLLDKWRTLDCLILYTSVSPRERKSLQAERKAIAEEILLLTNKTRSGTH